MKVSLRQVFRSSSFVNEGDEALFGCYRPKLHVDEKFAYALLSLLWGNFWLIAVGQCAVAGAVAVRWV